jgi:hypothetical protein
MEGPQSVVGVLHSSILPLRRMYVDVENRQAMVATTKDSRRIAGE